MKLRGQLPLSACRDAAAESGTALGDWYVNRIVVDRQPLLLLVSARSLLPLLLPAQHVRELPERLPAHVASTLHRLGISATLIAAEIVAMSTAVVAPTADRSVLGVLVDAAKSVPYHLEAGRWDHTTLPFVEAKLAQVPWHCGGRHADVTFPVKAVHELLVQRWGAG